MTTPASTKTTDASLAGDLLQAARYYLGGRWALAVLAIVAVAGGIAFNWSWLVAAGIAPVLLTALPCVVMCGLGLCMNKLFGGACASQSTQPSATAERVEPSTPVNLSVDPDATPEHLPSCSES
jgi:hypothetical protein